MIETLIPKFWKYVVVALVSILATSLFWTLTNFWRPATVIDEATDTASEKARAVEVFLEKEEDRKLKFEEKRKELEEDFYEKIPDEELRRDLDSLLDLLSDSAT